MPKYFNITATRNIKRFFFFLLFLGILFTKTTRIHAAVFNIIYQTVGSFRPDTATSKQK